MKHYSKILDENISIGRENISGLVHYTDKEVDVIKTLRQVIKDDNQFSDAVKFTHEIKKQLNGIIKDWEIPWDEKTKQEGNHFQKEKEESALASFWMQAQRETSENIAKEIKSRIKAKKSVARLKNILRLEDYEKYREIFGTI